MSQSMVVTDCHKIFIGGTIAMITDEYSKAKTITLMTAEDTLKQFLNIQPDLIITDILLPAKHGESPQISTGIQLLKTLMKKYPHLNIMVQSEHINNLIQIKSEIDEHQGGFVLANKSLGYAEILNRVKWCLQGLTHIQDIQKNSRKESADDYTN
ncbi:MULTISPECIES: hypothetical protein [unclassified Anabaena]|uniref:hypothetical protein n=1 Tax=unclassified Anabaena TaxID=2619674 RepID=UPI0020C53573|nr:MULTISPECIES: hypothetical protein [unclassified Anabaena]